MVKWVLRGIKVETNYRGYIKHFKVNGISSKPANQEMFEFVLRWMFQLAIWHALLCLIPSAFSLYQYSTNFPACVVKISGGGMCNVTNGHYSNNMLVEKLSAIAPHGPTKVRILTAIPNEHNIKWEPDCLKDRDEGPPAELLHKVNVDEANKMYVKPPSYEAGPTIERMRDVAANVYDTLITGENSSMFASIDIGASKMSSPATACTDKVLSRTVAKTMMFNYSPNRVEDAFSVGMQDWNMEFEDATADAQAAAESTERASMAARVAAELLSHGRVAQHGSTSYSASVVDGGDLNDQAKLTGGAAEMTLKNECTRSLKQCESKQEDNIVLEGYHFVNGGMRKQSKVSHIGVPDGSNPEFEASASSNYQAYQYESTKNPFYEETVEIRNQSSSSHSQSTALDKEYGIFSNLDHHSYGNKSEEPYVGFNQGNVYGGEQKMGEQSQNPSSHSGILYEENNDIFYYVATKHGIDSGEDPFLVLKQGSIKVESKQSDINADTAVVFDESGSDDGDYMLDLDAKHDAQNYHSDILSPSSKWLTHFSPVGDESPTNGGIESPFSSRHLYRPEITESFGKSSLSSQLGEPLPLAFDDSDGPNSESGEEEKPPQSKTGKRIGSRILHADSQEPELPSGTSQVFSAPSSAGKRTSRFSSGSVDANEHFKEDYGTKFDALFRNSLGSVSGLVDGLNQQSVETVRLMSKGSWRSMQSTTDSGRANELSVKSTMDLNFSLLTVDNDFGIKLVQMDSGFDQEPDNKTIERHVDKRSSLRAPIGFCDLDDSSVEEDVPRQTVTRTGYLGNGFSRRTRDIALRSVASSY
ncbi:hypothetical protein Ancab_028272 [Ancistrocladus abbreviatus]